MGKAVFVTATGTDLGKTAFSLALLLWAEKKGISAHYFKPVQCGFTMEPGQTAAGDSEWIARMAPFPITTKTGIRFSAAVSPHLAAERENQVLNLERFGKDIENLRGDCDLLVVEGAGGAAVPLNRKPDFLVDLALQGNFPSLLVCGLELGTLSYTLSTLAFLRERRVPVGGIAFSRTTPERPEIGDDNLRTLLDFSGLPLMGELPYQPSLQMGAGLKAEDIPDWLAPLEAGLEKWWTHCPT